MGRVAEARQAICQALCDVSRADVALLIDAGFQPAVTPDGSGTFNDFDATNTRGQVIDYILVRGMEVHFAQVDFSTHEGRAPSDHWPIVATVAW